jgi:hypothetical protein
MDSMTNEDVVAGLPLNDEFTDLLLVGNRYTDEHDWETIPSRSDIAEISAEEQKANASLTRKQDDDEDDEDRNKNESEEKLEKDVTDQFNASSIGFCSSKDPFNLPNDGFCSSSEFSSLEPHLTTSPEIDGLEKNDSIHRHLERNYCQFLPHSYALRFEAREDLQDLFASCLGVVLIEVIEC